jgi:bifunctional enzyme CysN/CysC
MSGTIADANAGRSTVSTTLRVLLCGSVDDGKSTLLGRLLHDAGQLTDDQLQALAADSARHGTRGTALDFSLVTDGLVAEREQNITIDVAYRFFSTPRRHFIVADAPGHEQYTRNMATGASTADVAVLLIDARKGLLTQTRRHWFVARLLGIEHFVLAINKMDLVEAAQQRFESIAGDCRQFAARLEAHTLTAIPTIAVDGGNVVVSSAALGWYRGPTLLQHLESLDPRPAAENVPLRFLTQWINRPNADFRGSAGVIVAGTARVGDAVELAPSRMRTRIERVITVAGDRPQATVGESVTLTLADERDVGRGDVIAAAAHPIVSATSFQAHIVWMHHEPLLQGRQYLLKLGARTVGATVAPIKHKIHADTLERLAAERLDLNDIGVCELSLEAPIPLEPYRQNRDLGGFILIDRLTQDTVGAGMIDFVLRRSQNVQWQAVDVSRALRSQLLGQSSVVVWFTGLSGAGKSTIANLVERKLAALGRHTYLLDGDNVRHGLNRDLGFTAQDRVENIRRVAEVARLMVDAGLITLVSFISPFRAERAAARALFAPGDFVEIFVDTPLAEAERRDTKGLYRKARSGELRNFTGIDSPYESPTDAELRVDTLAESAGNAADRIVAHLRSIGALDAKR